MRKILIICCSSYTALTLCFAFFSIFDLSPALTNEIAMQAFLMTLTIAVLITLSDKLLDHLRNSSLLLDILIRITICYLVAFLEGVLFGMFPLSFYSLLEITPVMLPVFFFTYLSAYLLSAEWAKNINAMIQTKKKQKEQNPNESYHHSTESEKKLR